MKTPDWTYFYYVSYKPHCMCFSGVGRICHKIQIVVLLKINMVALFEWCSSHLGQLSGNLPTMNKTRGWIVNIVVLMCAFSWAQSFIIEGKPEPTISKTMNQSLEDFLLAQWSFFHNHHHQECLGKTTLQKLNSLPLDCFTIYIKIRKK